MAKTAHKASTLTLSTVTTSAFTYSRNATAAYAAIVAAGGDTVEVRRAFVIGHMAATFNKKAGAMTAAMAASAEKILGYVGVDAKTVPAGSGRRTAEQERAYGAARTAWKQVRAKAGAKKDANKARAPRASKVAEKDASKVAPIVEAPKTTTPHVTKAPDAIAFLQQQAAMLLAFSNKNAKAVPIEARNAIGAFVAAMKELDAKPEATPAAPLRGQAMRDYQASQRQ